MHKGRLEAFSDAVIAIAMTVMVLELKEPRTGDLAGLWANAPIFSAYILSFVFLGIYWNNHHHMFQAVKSVNGTILWANLHLLFWLSVVPFFTSWMGGEHFTRVTVSAYGVVLIACGIAYYILTRCLIAHDGKDSDVAKALGSDLKGKISVVIYALGIAVAQVAPVFACGFYVAVACMWFIPDRRFERRLHGEQVK